MEEFMLTENEIQEITRGIYWDDQADGEMRSAYAVREAQAKKLVGYINKNLKGYEDTTVGQLLDSTFWREILKAVNQL